MTTKRTKKISAERMHKNRPRGFENDLKLIGALAIVFAVVWYLITKV